MTTKDHPTLEVSMIVKDEQEMIEKCLKSLKGADYITIVDTGSTDKTCEIIKRLAKEFEPETKIRLFENEYEWKNNFAEARNYALEKSVGDWEYVQDADEELQGGFQQVRNAILKYGDNHKVINVTLDMGGGSLLGTRIFKRDKSIRWLGAAHNYLTKGATANAEDVIIKVGYSPTHKNDPKRTLRILEKAVSENRSKPRELFYLGREYTYFKQWYSAISVLEKYVEVAYWAPEWAEAYYLLAKSYRNIGESNKAKDACLQVLKINADYKGALTMLSELSGPKNRLKWLEYAQYAEDKEVLFQNTPIEKDSVYYDKLFAVNTDMSRYEEIYKKVGEWAGGKMLLDIGCGLGGLKKYVEDWQGFDSSVVAIQTITNQVDSNADCWVGDLYDKGVYEDADMYAALEVLEHVDDRKVIENIQKGKELIFSVPSFKDPSHLRTYTEDIVRLRYKYLLDIKEVVRYNWVDNKWKQGGENTRNYILLVKSVKK